MPDAKLIAIGLQDGEHLAVLSSRHHVTWAVATGASLGGTPNYNHADCFYKYPFPKLTTAQKIRLRELGDELDAHRKRQQDIYPKLTLTQMYNVLEKCRAGEAIKGKDREIYNQGLIGILKDLHDHIDAAVAETYGWPVDLSDEEILLRLVTLNKERTEEETAGRILWLRPEYQNLEDKQVATGKTLEMDLSVVAKEKGDPWPKSLPDQIAAVRETLSELGEATPEQIARRFIRARVTIVQAQKVEEECYAVLR